MSMPPPAVGLSPTLAVNEAVTQRVAEGRPVLHLAFGEAGLPVHPLLRQALAASPENNSYAPVAGEPWLRESVASYFNRRGLPTDADLVVVGPGSKALLFALMLVLPGDVVLPQPSWVSYAAQAAITRKRVFRVPIPTSAGGLPEPDRLVECLRRVRAKGADPRILVLTQPDNPTGTLASRDLLEAIGSIARDEELILIADEIYRDLAFDNAARFVSMAHVCPERTIVTSGLSKSLALGGWRVGIMRAQDNDMGRSLVRNVSGVASEVWSCLSGPIAAAARVAFDEPPEIRAHIKASRNVHESVARATFKAVKAAGAACRAPQGAFYLYPDVSHAQRQLARRGIRTGRDLAMSLLERFDIAVLAGEAFGDEDALRFRISTSLLYGRTDEERWLTLSVLGPGNGGRIPEIDAAIHRLQAALEILLS